MLFQVTKHCGNSVNLVYIEGTREDSGHIQVLDDELFLLFSFTFMVLYSVKTFFILLKNSFNVAMKSKRTILMFYGILQRLL